MNLAQVDLNLLVALEAILTEKHLTRAGDRLGLSQPTMSHTLSRLRRLFSDELLIRVGREYYLTPLAEEIVEPLRDVLKSIELTIERRPAFDPATDQRSFIVSASDYATFLVLQPAIELMQEKAPKTSIQIRPLTKNANTLLVSGDVDLAFWPEAMGPDLPKERLFKDRWVGIAWAGHPDVDETLSLEEYLRQPHAAYGTSFEDISGMADRAVYALHPELQIAVMTPSFFLIPFLLGKSKLIALAHQRLATRLQSMADIKILELEFETPPVLEAMYWHPRMTADPAHRWLRETLKQSVQGMSKPNKHARGE